MINSVIRALSIGAGLLIAWQALVLITDAPSYILPGPVSVFHALTSKIGLITYHASITGIEILTGSFIGIAVGLSTALTMSYYRPLHRWLMPVLVASQAVPVFALAPLLTLWFGYGMASKILMAALIIYFPVTATFLDGLRRTEPGWIDIAISMGASSWRILRYIRLPAALPAAASGVRVALAVAPIGAVVGEWVGSSAGLGYLMLHANARMQIDVMFAALATLTAMGLLVYFSFDWLMRRALTWQPDSHSDHSTKEI